MIDRFGSSAASEENVLRFGDNVVLCCVFVCVPGWVGGCNNWCLCHENDLKNEMIVALVAPLIGEGGEYCALLFFLNVCDTI